jgi:hypothetical protein
MATAPRPAVLVACLHPRGTDDFEGCRRCWFQSAEHVRITASFLPVSENAALVEILAADDIERIALVNRATIGPKPHLAIIKGRAAMHYGSLLGVLAITIALTAGGAAATDSKYPDLKGQWERMGTAGFDPAQPSARRPRPPLTAEYRAIWDAHLADGVLLLCPAPRPRTAMPRCAMT